MKKDLADYEKQFQPPKIPAWSLFLVFLFPLTIAVLPAIFAIDSINFYIIAIIALCVLCAVLTVCCFNLILKRYSEAYALQLQEFKLDEIESEASRAHKRIDELNEIADKAKRGV